MDNDLVALTKSKRQQRRKHPYSSNFVHLILDRETGFRWSDNRRKLSTNLEYELPMFKCFPPNFTIQNVDKPHGFMRKFTPNGRFLLSFSSDQRSLDIYEYRGVGAIADLLQNQKNEYVFATDNTLTSLLIRQKAFRQILVLRRSLRIAYFGIPGGYLNREFGIFLNNGQYVLIASMGISTEPPPFENIFEYPDIFYETDLFFYNFYLIDLEKEYISDCYSYKYDTIPLSHNQGVSVNGPTLAIYSKYRQCIDLFEIANGTIHKTYTIGPHGAYLREPNEMFSIDDTIIVSMPITHLKQRILTYIFRTCNSEQDVDVRRKKLRDFYRDFPKYELMIISKMQLLGRNKLLIRYEQNPNYTDRDMENANEPDIYPFKLYVFYCITTQKILKLYFQNSNELLYLLRDHCDFFRNVRSMQTGRCPSSSSNNIHLLASFNDTVATISDPPQRLNPTLPISTQSHTTSPYLDYNLFLYDDRQISALERPRASLKETFCFRDRDTEQPLFRFHLEPWLTENTNFGFTDDRSLLMHTRRELVAFIFHPYEPFVISLQKLLQRYVVNFHLYNKATIVKE